MSTPEARAACLSRKRPNRCPTERNLLRFAQRRPMTQLADQYRVTKTNPEPPLVRFAIPVEMLDLYKYADKHGLVRWSANLPSLIAPKSAVLASKRLSEEAQYELGFGWPFTPTADCGIILSLYDNYTIDEKMLIDEDQEDVIQLVQEELGLDRSVRPKWYFDFHDPFVPDEEFF